MDREQGARVRERDAKPTGRQIYALAHELLKQVQIEFPRTRGAASDLIERLRAADQNGEGARR